MINFNLEDLIPFEEEIKAFHQAYSRMMEQTAEQVVEDRLNLLLIQTTADLLFPLLQTKQLEEIDNACVQGLSMIDNARKVRLFGDD